MDNSGQFRQRILVTLCLLSAGLSIPAGAARPAGQTDSALDRGRYLTQAANCKGCHTTILGQPYAGSVAFDTPFGTLYSTNITADEVEGIGAWTEDEFVRAMHEGIGRNGQHLYPAFPYTAYTQLSREDVIAIRDYLMAQPVVAHEVPSNDMKFPFSNRSLLWFWKLMNFDEGRFAADEDQSEQWNRGAYLTEALGHCGQCHTPRTLTQGLDDDEKFAGAVLQGWRAYNITPHETGIGNWSGEELRFYLSTGHIPDKIASGGPMADVVTNSLRHLSPEDIDAMATYLETIPPQAGIVPALSDVSFNLDEPAEDSALAATMASGEQLFETACVSCHYPDGGGPGGAYPLFPHHSAVRAEDGLNLINVMLQGLERHGSDGYKFMPAYHALMNDEQIAAVVTYVGRRFGGYEADFSAEDIRKQRQEH
ncbi:cytochrome c [Allohahella marinimesophila]|uniref:Cytochrome c n=1 Tax=Allohahella marinimesophila TaxID=1054972 RepID=A0ABP7PIH0_9GAMM